MGTGADKGTISAQVLAELCDITPRRVQQLAGEGFFKKSGHGKYLLKGAGAAYKDYCVQSEIDRRNKETSSKEQYDMERARKLKLQNDQTEALLMETSSGISAVDCMFGELQATLAGIPSRLTDDVAERRRIEQAIDDAFTDLAAKFEETGDALQKGLDPLEAGGEGLA